LFPRLALKSSTTGRGPLLKRVKLRFTRSFRPAPVDANQRAALFAAIILSLMWNWFYQLASPPHFFRLAGRLQPWFAVPALLTIVFGVYAGLVLAPPDYQQGDAFRIIYVHVPSAWLSLF